MTWYLCLPKTKGRTKPMQLELPTTKAHWDSYYAAWWLIELLSTKQRWPSRHKNIMDVAAHYVAGIARIDAITCV